MNALSSEARTLTNGSVIHTEPFDDTRKNLICSRQCQFFKALHWDPANGMDAGKMTYVCSATNHHFGFNQNGWKQHFVILRTKECVSKDPNHKVAIAREQYVREIHGRLGTVPDMETQGYTLSTN